MRIGLNLLYLIPGQVGGTQVAAESLLRALAAVDSSNEYVVFVNREAATFPLPDATAPNFSRVVCPMSAQSRVGRYAWEQFTFPRFLKPHKLDVLHSPGYVGPLRAPCPTVVTIHDINYIGMGAAMSKSRRVTLGFFVPQCARQAAHVIAVSQFSKDEIVRHTGVDSDKITVVHNALRDDLSVGAHVDWDEIAQAYTIQQPYLAAFSSTGAHKNLLRLIQAFARLSPDVPHQLVLIGHLPTGGDTEAEHVHQTVRENGLEGRVVVTGYVPDAHVLPLLSNAQAFAFPSWYEGFGLPVLEAQRAGVPVACSTAASLPEVAGAGAEYFDPTSLDEMTDALRRLMSDESLREHLRQAGTENLRRFSWHESARRTIAVYERVARRTG